MTPSPDTSRVLRLELTGTDFFEISAAVKKALGEKISGLLVNGSWSDWNNLPQGWLERLSEVAEPLKQANKKLIIGITSLGECLGIEPGLPAAWNSWIKGFSREFYEVRLWLETPEEASRLPDSWWEKWEALLRKLQTGLPLSIRLPAGVLFQTDENRLPAAEKLLAKASGLVLGERITATNHWITYSERAVFVGAMLQKPVWIDFPPYPEKQQEKIDFLLQTVGDRLAGIVIPYN